jgi:anaerobic magnesium-protoporphyrin IX monomethyl ester cyclase
MRPKKIEKVQLVFPPPKRPDTVVTKFAKWPQPLGILSIGAYLQEHNPGVKVEVLDGNNVLSLDEVINSLSADVVGISLTGVGYEYGIEIARHANEKGAAVVLGGAAATPLAKEILKFFDFVDAVFKYDSEVPFSKFIAGEPLASIENLVYRDDGKPKENPIILPDLDSLPPPNRDLVDMEVYFRNSQHHDYPMAEPFKRPMNIYSQKGCVWRSQHDGGCIFCSIPYYDYRLRDPTLVWNEISYLVERYQTDFIWDPSDNLVGDKEWFKRFCQAKPKDLKIHYTNYVDAKGVDEEVARLLADTGCVSVFVGMEAGDPAMLKNMNKRSTLEDNLRAMEILHKYRLGVIVGVVIGVQGETKESLTNTFEFLKRLYEFDNLDRIEWGVLVPFPGSKANMMLREHPELKEKYRNFGDKNYTSDMISMMEDWFRHYCNIDFDYVLKMQDMIAQQGLVPYEMTRYQRRSWSGTPTKVFLA